MSIISQIPSGLFILNANSNIGTSGVRGLINISEELYRNIKIITDIHLQIDEKYTYEETSYDYLVIASRFNEIKKYKDKINSAKWTCWIDTVMISPIEQKEAIEKNKQCLKENIDVFLCPNVNKPMGGPEAILFNKDRICNFIISIDYKNLWREIFRASNFYKGKIYAS